MIALFVFRDINNKFYKLFTGSSYYKHVDVITFDGHVRLAHLFRKTGVETKFVKQPVGKLMQGLYKCKSVVCLIAVELRGKRKKVGQFVINTCNEYARKMSGLDIPFTFNPKSLMKKLVKYDGKRNYKILSRRMK